MKNPYVLTLAVSLFGCTAQEVKKPTQYSMTQFMDIVQINGGAFSPDESRIMINSKATGIFNAVEIDINTGEQKAMTHSADDAISSESYFPADNRIVYSSDKGGDEIDHLFVRNPDGSIVDLISDAKAKAAFTGWSFDR